MIWALTKNVYFDKASCDERFVFSSENDIYKVIWNGEKYPTFCALRFKTLSSDTYISKDTYNLCATVTKFSLECERDGEKTRTLYFSWGAMMNEKRYDCHASLPITYCNKDYLNVALEPRLQDIHRSNSAITITITAKLVSTQSFDTIPTTSVVGAVLGTVMGLIVLVVAVTCCVILCRTQLKPATQLREAVIIVQNNNANVTTANGGQQFQQHTGHLNQGQSSNFIYNGNIQPSAPLLDPNVEQTLDSYLAPPPSYSEVMERRSDYGV